MKGILSPIRTTLAELTVETTINAQLLDSQAMVWSIVLVLIASVFFLVRKSTAPAKHIAGAVVIGLLVPAAWVGTGFVLQDDFDPIVFQSLSFTSPSSEWLFWSIASTSTGAGFGVGLLSGVVLGSAITAIAKSEFLSLIHI